MAAITAAATIVTTSISGSIIVILGESGAMFR